LGFGHVEVGTITPRPQAGNPRPRVHRLPQVQGIINSMGFPNAGAEAIRADRWQAVRPNVRVGLNLGKGKDTPLERAAEDYIALLQRFHRQVDYFTINVSSPNTLGLRQLQTRTFIEDLLSSIAQARDALVPRVPLLVKIAPDLTESEIDAVLDASLAAGIDGLIATNTTVGRAGLPPDAAELKGGLSGQPLKARATAVIRYIAQCTAGRLPVIGVGGIASAADAIDKLQAGAWLVQVYTGLIYAGPSLAREINLGMLKCHET
jgi:dihydroorotate dehydrogenase